MLFPASFSAPSSASFEGLEFRLLGPEDADADHRAVLQSAPRIRGVFGPTNEWPPANLSFEDNLSDIRRHLAESQANKSFAYSIWRDSAYAGCLYIKPFKSRLEVDHRRQRYKEVCFLWVTNDLVSSEASVLASCRAWVLASFPVLRPVWPGRDVSWADWDAQASAQLSSPASSQTR
ncbi:hypothetical protein [Ideonella oryzae]|uniref:N-acetyltransferase domain-containing protein n=1 Tax=Ideonella oryzae TaxID=2937441 RepID=A0ABT1BJS1_9BURK|nr:hypothetical protein [Ideonella oryzae]MCO5975862.1 hypothetical protein [Ideonella oryzae]